MERKELAAPLANLVFILLLITKMFKSVIAIGFLLICVCFRDCLVIGCSEHDGLVLAMSILANIRSMGNANGTALPAGNAMDLLPASTSEQQMQQVAGQNITPPPTSPTAPPAPVLNLFSGGVCRNLPPPQFVAGRSQYVPRRIPNSRLGSLPQQQSNTLNAVTGSTTTLNLRGLADSSDSTCAELPTRRITPLFLQWLQENGYADYDFASNGCGTAAGSSFGGRSEVDNPQQQSEENMERRPVIFIHGATDSAVGSSVVADPNNNTTKLPVMCGWSNSIRNFLDNGYKMSDLYALTWGNDKPPHGHHPVYVDRINKFIQAVLNYSGSPKIDIIAHSMGVTLTRGAIVGGINGELARLSSRVSNFIGISGANRGVSWCTSAGVPFCDWENGFSRNSPYLRSLNAHDKTRIASNIYSIWSPQDEVLQCSGEKTANSCLVPGQKCDVQLADLNHLQLKDKTAGVQFSLLNTGKCA